MTKKYKVGTHLKVLNKSFSGFKRGDIIEIIKPKSWPNHYSIKDAHPVDGWSVDFIENTNVFIPVNIKIENWRERII